MYITRNYRRQTVAVALNSTESEVFEIGNAAFVGLMITSTALSSTTLTPYCAYDSTGPFLPVYVGVSQVTVAAGPSRCLDFGASRTALVPYRFMKLGGNTGELAARTIEIQTK